jgi:hypothetical protein
MQTYSFETIYRPPLPKHTWETHIVAIWNTKGRNCLNACNKNWLKELAEEFFEAKWEINNIHSDPYPSALSTEEKLIKLSSAPPNQSAGPPR